MREFPKAVSPLRWPGGKQKIAKKIVDRFPHRVRVYREPFVGGGSVFLEARSRGFARHYHINDLYKPLIAFYHMVQSDGDLLALTIEGLHQRYQNDRQRRFYYDRLMECRNSGKAPTSSPEEIAANFFFLNRVTFSGTCESGGFSASASVDRFTKSSIERVRKLWRSGALDNVKITNDPAFACMTEKRCRTDTFFFLDPPYHEATKLYGVRGGLHKEFDHEYYAKVIKKMSQSSRFLMTYDDCPEIRKLYRWAKISEFNLQYSMREGKGEEIFIQNY